MLDGTSGDCLPGTPTGARPPVLRAQTGIRVEYSGGPIEQMGWVRVRGVHTGRVQLGSQLDRTYYMYTTSDMKLL